VVWGRYCECELLIANPIDWLYAACLEYFIFFSIDTSEAPTPQGVEHRNILLWFKCVLTALHINCMILFDKVL
jgi:hypothetical protein